MKIDGATLREISDSLGRPTIEVGIQAEDNNFSASIPSGESRGSREAVVFSPEKARESLKSFEGEIIGKDFKSIRSFDGFLIALDGTPNKAKLGGNLILGLSLAFARGLAFRNNLELWEVLRREFFSGTKEAENPRILSNFIEGGVHTENNLYIQEFWVVAKVKGSVSEMVDRLSGFHKVVGESLREKYPEVDVGDESGYSQDFPDNFGPIEFLGNEITKNGLEKDLSLGVDAAASSFYKGGRYGFEGKQLNSEELMKVYLEYFKKAPLLSSIEDPFDEDDGESFGKLLSSLKGGKLVIGDDLTVTNPEAIRDVASEKMINGVIIKPNQIGTVSETCAAMNAAQGDGLKCIVSHRAGETEDGFLVHFAKAGGAYGVKIGAPVESRLSKFKEMLRLYS